MQDGECVAQCDHQHYLVVETKECLDCHESCLACNAEMVCEECAAGYFDHPEKGLCVLDCGEHYFEDIDTGKCVRCFDACLTCIGEDNGECLSCVEDNEFYEFKNGFCERLICEVGSYVDRINDEVACLPCTPPCKTCFGGDPTQCISCLPNYVLQTTVCVHCSAITGFESSYFDPEVCIEICGDGLNYGEYECDDGNNLNGDGCDKDCMIEPGYECEGGDENNRDVCVDNIGPQCLIS